MEFLFRLLSRQEKKPNGFLTKLEIATKKTTNEYQKLSSNKNGSNAFYIDVKVVNWT